MRLHDFITYLREHFRVQNDAEARRIIADAMSAADSNGSCTFWLDGAEYTITAEFKHGCINYDCNPATCWTEWTISGG